MKKRWIPTLLVFIVTICALLPSALSLPQHGDEAQYGWSSAYYGGKAVRLDFSLNNRGDYRDPGWIPTARWALTQPMGTRWVYALTMAATNAPAPQLPQSFSDPALQGPDAYLVPYSLLMLRFAAILCAALGLAFIAWRYSPYGVVACLAFLFIPHVRDDLARAWAEGPLLLGLGLCALSYGTRWFAPLCGIASTFKLTALGLWPIAIWHGFGKGRFRHLFGFLSTVIVWSILTPPSWFVGGPPYVLMMLLHRSEIYASQSANEANLFGLFLPTRYFWPAELAILLSACWLLMQRYQAVRTKKPTITESSAYSD
jgi:hypothetical protein